jgi:hypothetical protein
MSDDPLFISAIMRIQQENWDDDTQSTVTPEQAAKMAVKGAPKALRQEVEELYERLHKALGKAAPEAKPRAKPPVKAKGEEGETKEVDRPNGRPKPVNDKDWLKYAVARMNESRD